MDGGSVERRREGDCKVDCSTCSRVRSLRLVTVTVRIRGDALRITSGYVDGCFGLHRKAGLLTCLLG